jgi:hypothetical protein
MKLKSELIEENKLLLERLDRLENIIIQQKSHKERMEKEEDALIPMHKIIKVVSLYEGILYLKTAVDDRHGSFKFNFFGDEQPIFYSDLVKAISIQPRFFREGFCMILDSDVIKTHYLADVYKKLLTKDEIDNFLNLSETEIREKYEYIPIQQKITILERIAKKINDKTINVDRNKIDIVKNVSEQDLYELAKKLN